MKFDQLDKPQRMQVFKEQLEKLMSKEELEELNKSIENMVRNMNDDLIKAGG